MAYERLKRNNRNQIESLIITLKEDDEYGFIYCRSKQQSLKSKQSVNIIKTVKCY